MRAPGVASTVLVVDDDPALRLLCKVNLELEGYRVLEAATLEAAADALGTGGVGVILLDVHVGGGDGRAFLRRLRDEENSVPVALFTGSSEIDHAHRRLADEVLPKPFELDQLTSTVARLASRLGSAA
jgi:DNA-binding response OmpR family regulator